MVHQHVKGHSGIFGNLRADRAANKGALAGEVNVEYKSVADLGGALRFAEYYHAGDCGRDCDLERKYAGKARARRVKMHENSERAHARAIRGHARFFAPEVQTKIQDVLDDLAKT